MSGLPWTKFQDFYLRVGFMKALVAALDPHRRSATNEAVYRRLETPLFHPARDYLSLWNTVRSRIDWYDKKSATPSDKGPLVAEALLVAGDCPSLLFAVTRPTIYKILDWGHDIGLVGRGNQITERGLLLRFLAPVEAMERFLAGDTSAWNPFVLSDLERIFFAFHLGDIDRVTAELVGELGGRSPGEIVESPDAATLTCRALFKVLDGASHALAPRDLPAYRVARDLACTIARELDLEEFKAKCGDSATRRVPKPAKPGTTRVLLSRSRSAQEQRPRRKNADHQTIPRFEQLVDLGFLVKPDGEGKTDDAKRLHGRRRWRYEPSPVCKRWTEALAGRRMDEPTFLWNGFARTVVRAFQFSQSGRSSVIDQTVVLNYLWEAYITVHRQIGHTPADSVALFAMLQAAVHGQPIEMAAFHDFLLQIKVRSLMPEHAFFASGNTLDKMFVLLKPGFAEMIPKVAGHLDPMETA